MAISYFHINKYFINNNTKVQSTSFYGCLNTFLNILFFIIVTVENNKYKQKYGHCISIRVVAITGVTNQLQLQLL